MVARRHSLDQGQAFSGFAGFIDDRCIPDPSLIGYCVTRFYALVRSRKNCTTICSSFRIRPRLVIAVSSVNRPSIMPSCAERRRKGLLIGWKSRKTIASIRSRARIYHLFLFFFFFLWIYSYSPNLGWGERVIRAQLNPWIRGRYRGFSEFS